MENGNGVRNTIVILLRNIVFEELQKILTEEKEATIRKSITSSKENH